MLFCHMTMHGAAKYCQDIVVMETKPTHGDGVLCLMKLCDGAPQRPASSFLPEKIYGHKPQITQQLPVCSPCNISFFFFYWAS